MRRFVLAENGSLCYEPMSVTKDDAVHLLVVHKMSHLLSKTKALINCLLMLKVTCISFVVLI